MRSANVPTCVVPRTFSSYGDRSFAASGPRLWNSLPVQLRNLDITYELFRRQLKGHLIREALTRRSVTCYVAPQAPSTPATMSKQRSILSKHLSTLLSFLTTMSNEISSFRQSQNKLNTLNIVAGVDGALEKLTHLLTYLPLKWCLYTSLWYIWHIFDTVANIPFLHHPIDCWNGIGLNIDFDRVHCTVASTGAHISRDAFVNMP